MTPYTDDVQSRILANYAALGFPCAAERHLGLSENFAFSEVGAGRLRDLARAVAGEGADALAVVCTNLRAAPLVEAMEAELGLPVYDTIATVVWKSLVLAGVDPARVEGWGRLFGALRD